METEKYMKHSLREWVNKTRHSKTNKQKNKALLLNGCTSEWASFGGRKTHLLSEEVPQAGGVLPRFSSQARQPTGEGGGGGASAQRPGPGPAVIVALTVDSNPSIFL